jgi:hypothetical protein
MPDDKVVRLDVKGANEAPLKLVEEQWGDCQHARFDIHASQPLVSCRDCDATLDAYFVLRKIASAFSQRTWRIEQLKRENERMEKNLRRQQATRRSPHLKENDGYGAARCAAVTEASIAAFDGDARVLPQDLPDAS